MLLDIVLIQYPLPIGMALKEQCLHATCIACKLPEQQHQLADSLQREELLGSRSFKECRTAAFMRVNSGVNNLKYVRIEEINKMIMSNFCNPTLTQFCYLDSALT